jgi:hypothetical protein
VTLVMTFASRGSSSLSFRHHSDLDLAQDLRTDIANVDEILSPSQ